MKMICDYSSGAVAMDEQMYFFLTSPPANSREIVLIDYLERQVAAGHIQILRGCNHV